MTRPLTGFTPGVMQDRLSSTQLSHKRARQIAESQWLYENYTPILERLGVPTRSDVFAAPEIVVHDDVSRPTRAARILNLIAKLFGGARCRP